MRGTEHPRWRLTLQAGFRDPLRDGGAELTGGCSQMAVRDQRSDTDCRGAEGRSGVRTGFSLGRTALTGWALTAVLGLAGFGAVLDAGPVPVLTPVRVADTTPLGEVGAIA